MSSARVFRGTALAFAILASACALRHAPVHLAEPDCVHDEAELFALDFEAFDQDLASGGWRAVAAREGCGFVAAELIARWRERHIDGLAPGQLQILWWHEGQVLAAAGDYAAAIDRLTKAREFRDPPPPADAPAEQIAMWNAMAAAREGWEDANIAFLRRDRAALVAARDRMMAVPEPDAYRTLQDVFEERTGQRMAWPLNIEGVERMIACFDYRYGVECRQEK